MALAAIGAGSCTVQDLDETSEAEVLTEEEQEALQCLYLSKEAFQIGDAEKDEALKAEAISTGMYWGLDLPEEKHDSNPIEISDDLSGDERKDFIRNELRKCTARRGEASGVPCLELSPSDIENEVRSSNMAKIGLFDEHDRNELLSIMDESGLANLCATAHQQFIQLVELPKDSPKSAIALIMEGGKWESIRNKYGQSAVDDLGLNRDLTAAEEMLVNISPRSCSGYLGAVARTYAECEIEYQARFGQGEEN